MKTQKQRNTFEAKGKNSQPLYTIRPIKWEKERDPYYFNEQVFKCPAGVWSIGGTPDKTFTFFFNDDPIKKEVKTEKQVKAIAEKHYTEMVKRMLIKQK
jgi:hypothetical protein